MDYAENYDEFVSMLCAFDYDKGVQLSIIERKLQQYIALYEGEKSYAGKEDCLKQVSKLNALFTRVLVQKAHQTIGVGLYTSIKDIRERKDLLLTRYNGSGDKESLRMYGEIVRAFDVIQTFST
jgi:hypothetical protein